MSRDEQPGSPIRIVLADDHPIFRDGLRRLLESEPGFAVVGEAADGVAAIDVARAVVPDVLLLDVAMPRMSGLECLPGLVTIGTRVILLTAALTESSMLRAFRLGARGVVLKETATRRLLDAIRQVMAGRFVAGEGALDDLVSALQRVEHDRDARRFDLTPRETQIVQAIVQSQSNREIAALFGISTETVKHHLTSIFNKTGVSTRLELAMFAPRHGLSDTE
jgi:DNA-binding NarL/FixJ family response regulator